MIDTAAIRNLPRFAGVSPDGLRWLSERMVRGEFAKGATVFREGDPCGHLHLVEKGMVKVFKNLESGRELILDIFRTGESFGEVALIDEVEYPASAAALEPTRVLSLTRRDYLALIQNYPESALAVIRDLTLRMHALRRRVEQLGEGGVECRLAQVLTAFARRMGQENHDGLLIPVQITRQELADMVGARIETVIRIMSRWNKNAQVNTVEQGFLVPEPLVLERLSHPHRQS